MIPLIRLQSRTDTAVAHGANTNATSSSAPKNDKCAAAPSPAAVASTAPAPNISTGTYSGSTSSDSSAPPPRTPSVSAAPTAPIRLNVGVPSSSDASRTSCASALKSNCNPSSGAMTTSGSPVASQCAATFASTSIVKRMRRERELLERAVGIVACEQARQRQHRREQRRDPDDAGPHHAQQRRVGTHPERKEARDDREENERGEHIRAMTQARQAGRGARSRAAHRVRPGAFIGPAPPAAWRAPRSPLPGAWSGRRCRRASRCASTSA